MAVVGFGGGALPYTEHEEEPSHRTDHRHQARLAHLDPVVTMQVPENTGHCLLNTHRTP